MTDDNNCTVIVIESLDERLTTIDIQVVGWFIEDHDMRAVKSSQHQ